MKRYRVFIDIVGEYKAGDPPPSGYCDWHEWARVQSKAGLKQRRCWSCGLWRFPQERCHGPKPPDLHAAAIVIEEPIRRRRRATK